MADRLTQKAPRAVSIDGVRHELSTNYRNCLLTLYALEDDELAHWEKIDILVDNMYIEPYPTNTQAAVNEALRFLRCGNDPPKDQKDSFCHFSIDSKYIFNAMLKRGVDLDKQDDMHWWTFMSHFAEIGDSAFARIVYLRQQNKRGKLTKEERRECDIIGWDIIDMVTPKKKELHEQLEAYFNSDV